MINQEGDTTGDQHTASNESQDTLSGKEDETGFPHEQQPQQAQQLPAPELQVTTKPRKIGLTKYTIYVTNQRMYIVGSNLRETVFRILEIDLTSYDKLIIMEDNVYFTRNEIMDVLNGLEETSEGGLTKKITAVGLLGFIKFTKYYYLLVVIKRRPIAVLGGYEIYHIDETELIPVTNNPKKADRNSEEARYVQTFLNIDLNKTFYYSYSYDLTNSLQTNMVRNKLESLGINDNLEMNKVAQFNKRFVWNSALLKPVFQSSFDRVYDWFQAIIHGFIDQVKISIFDVQVYVTLIARRSHHFAGARFFKRGVNDVGDVANEVETEQIVCDLLTSSFHDPAAGFYNNPRYTSFVQHRGSIPLSWSQATAPNIRMTKPPIEIDVVDPFYSKSAIHFDDLFQRYGTPIQVLNLIKQREKTPRETKLLDAFQECINYLNQFLPKDKNIQYTAWDMSRASKSRGQDVIEWLENYSEQTLQTTGFFHNGKTILDTKLQQGICRTNCVDCLDRTNTAQFVIGKRALGHQLYALGLIEEKYLEYDSDVTNILTEMFHDHGDTIALQYGGSHLVNTLQTYRKINQWTSHSRDIIESVKRFYSNSFMDAQRQEAINLFLGNYVYEKGIPMLWELNTDYYLHNKESNTNISGKISYTHWYSDKNLSNEKKNLDGLYLKLNKDNFFSNLQKKSLIIIKIEPYTGCFENYWNEKYSSRDLISFNELFEFKMNSTMQYGINSEQKINSGVKNEVSPNAFNFPFILTGKNEIKNNKEANDNDTESNYSLKTSISTNTGLNNNNFSESSEKYFSPFKSRKPHRELKFQYVYKGKIEKEKESKAYSEFKRFGENDEKRFTEFENENEKEEALKFSILQVKNFKIIQKRMDNILMITKKKIVKEEKQTINSLPIIDIKNIGILNDEYELNDFNKTVIDMKEDVKDDADEDTESIYNLMKDNYGSGLPTVDKYEIKFYNESVNIEHKLKVVNHDSIYLNEHINEMVHEYSNIISPAISNKDLELYKRMAKGIEEIVSNTHNGETDIILPKFDRNLNSKGIQNISTGSDIPNSTIILHPDDYFSFSQLNTGLRRSLSMYSVGGLQSVENSTSPNNLTN